MIETLGVVEPRTEEGSGVLPAEFIRGGLPVIESTAAAVECSVEDAPALRGFVRRTPVEGGELGRVVSTHHNPG